MRERIPVAVLGATGMVGQRLVSLLSDHPWFEPVCLVASSSSAGMPYAASVAGRWAVGGDIPASAAELRVTSLDEMGAGGLADARVVFSAMSLPSTETAALEESLARRGVMVVSNSSAHRWTPDVPLLLPEVNPGHLELLRWQRDRLGTARGGIVVKPNCSIQSYVVALAALADLRPTRVVVTSMQAASGAGRRLSDWPELEGNVIPLIPGEEEKSEREPLRVLGRIGADSVELADIDIAATCVRVAVADGHLASVQVDFAEPVQVADVEDALRAWRSPLAGLHLPTAPAEPLVLHTPTDRPQPRLDADVDGGMAFHVGRVRSDGRGGARFIGLTHNTLRGAAGGSVLSAELLAATGWLDEVADRELVVTPGRGND